MRKILLFTLVILVLFMLIPAGYLADSTQRINAHGTINYSESSLYWIPSDAESWFSADFENTYIINPSDTWWNGQFSDWEISHTIGRANSMAIVTDPTNSDNKCLRVLYGEKTDYNKPNRPQIYSYHEFKEHYFSGWYYFPSDFEVVGWYILGAGFGQQSNEYSSIYGNGIVIGCNTVISPNLDVSVELHDFYPTQYSSDRRYLLPHTKLGTLPLGRWFNIRYHIKLDETNGVLEFWFDKPNGDESPDIIYTGITYKMTPEGPNTRINFVDHYSDLGNPEKYQYSDNLNVWSR